MPNAAVDVYGPQLFGGGSARRHSDRGTLPRRGGGEADILKAHAGRCAEGARERTALPLFARRQHQPRNGGDGRGRAGDRFVRQVLGGRGADGHSATPKNSSIHWNDAGRSQTWHTGEGTNRIVETGSGHKRATGPTSRASRLCDVPDALPGAERTRIGPPPTGHAARPSAELGRERHTGRCRTLGGVLEAGQVQQWRRLFTAGSGGDPRQYVTNVRNLPGRGHRSTWRARPSDQGIG